MKDQTKLLKSGSAGIGIVCLLAILLSSCLKDHSNYIVPPSAALTVVQGSPDAPAEVFYLDNNRVNQAALNFGDHIDYFNAYAGTRNAIVYSYGTANKIASDTIHLTANNTYSLFLANTYTKPDFILLKDTINRPANGQATIRFVNVSPNAPAADLDVNDTTVFVSNKAYKGYSSFAAITGNIKYNFEVRQHGTSTVLATLDTVTIRSGFVYTIWLRGLAAGTGNSKLSAGIINNAFYY
jgi:hypothetical protein